jgi:hypothetical protein
MRPISDFQEMVTTAEGKVPRFVIVDPACKNPGTSTDEATDVPTQDLAMSHSDRSL